MRKIIVSEFLSLDGVMEAPENWHFSYISDDMAAYLQASINGADAFLYGRVTYDIHAPAWSAATENEFGIADKLNSAPKYVVSTTLKKADWNNTTIIGGNMVEALTTLKQQGSGYIGLDGSATLVQSLMEADLVDEYHLFVHPVVVGTGKRLFNDGSKANLKLVKSQAFELGVVLLVYEPDRKA